MSLLLLFQPQATGSSVLTKTQPATARITVSVAKTQTAISRIQVTGTKTQGATARISLSVTKTQTSTARIQLTVTKTQTAVARITISGTKTQTSTARIQITNTKTQSAVARISKTLTATQSAVANIAGGNRSLSFNGTSTSAVLPAGVTTPSTGFTVAMWVYPTAQVSGARLIDNQDAGPLNGMAISQGASGTNLSIGNGSSGTALSSPFGVITLNVWTHLAASFDGTTARVYVNGNLIATSASGSMVTSTTATTLGKRATASSNFFQGLIDEVNIFSSRISTAAVLALYQGTVPGTLTAQYLVDEGSGTSILDTSGNSFTGTTSNATYSSNVHASLSILTKTQTATANIGIATTKTQPAIARIGLTGTKTQLSTARIQATATKTQTATARITVTSIKTQPALARIQISNTKTQVATARLVAAGVPLTKTQTSVARIANTNTKTQTATARILSTVSAYPSYILLDNGHIALHLGSVLYEH